MTSVPEEENFEFYRKDSQDQISNETLDIAQKRFHSIQKNLKSKEVNKIQTLRDLTHNPNLFSANA